MAFFVGLLVGLLAGITGGAWFGRNYLKQEEIEIPYLYSSLADMKNYIDTRNLVSLTVDDDTVDMTVVGNIDETVLQACENAAALLIDNYLRFSYDVPLAGANLTQEIIQLTAKLTHVQLWQRRAYVPDVIQKMETDCIERLRRIAAAAEEVREGQTVAKLPGNRM